MKNENNEWKEIYTDGGRILRARINNYAEIQYQYFTFEGEEVTNIQSISRSELRKFAKIAKILL